MHNLFLVCLPSLGFLKISYECLSTWEVLWAVRTRQNRISLLQKVESQLYGPVWFLGKVCYQCNNSLVSSCFGFLLLILTSLSSGPSIVKLLNWKAAIQAFAPLAPYVRNRFYVQIKYVKWQPLSLKRQFWWSWPLKLMLLYFIHSKYFDQFTNSIELYSPFFILIWKQEACL